FDRCARRSPAGRPPRSFPRCASTRWPRAVRDTISSRSRSSGSRCAWRRAERAPGRRAAPAAARRFPETPMNHPRAFPESLKRPLPGTLVDALRARFGERFSSANAVREHHGRDESPFPVTPPDAVVFARSTDEVADAVRQCRAYKVPVIPFGVGSSLEGHLLAVQGGLSIDVSQMNRVLAVNAEDLTVTVQAGVTRKQLNEELKST